MTSWSWRWSSTRTARARAAPGRPESLRYDARTDTVELDSHVPEPMRMEDVRVVRPAEGGAKK